MSYCIDQRQLPGTTRLYSDYLYSFDRVARWYGATGSPYAAGSLAAAAGAVLFPAERRRAVAEVLERGQRELPASAAREAMLARFRQSDTVAIVTGQQVGLFGGPLLTIYKALTAIRLAEQLRSEGSSAVAIFWLASQDHDLAEIDHTWVLDAESHPRRIALAAAAAIRREPVGRLRLGAQVGTAIEAWAAATGQDAAELRACYRPEASFASAFRELLARWFEPWGLLFVDPLDPELARLAADTLCATAARAPEVLAALAERSRELKAAGYHAQVTAADGAALIFGERAGERVALRREDEGWRWGEESLSGSELARRIAAAPERFSPAALLRPVVQDALLPTAAQVCGPAETAYLAQSAALYRSMGRRQPLIYPRVSATLVDARTRRLLEKYQWTVAAVWEHASGPEPAAALAATLARQALPEELERTLAAMRDAWGRQFAALLAQITALDPTLADSTATAVGKMRHQLEQIENRVSRALARRHEDLGRHAQALVGELFPERQLQERLRGGADLLARRPAVLELLHDQIQPRCPDHQAIEI